MDHLRGVGVLVVVPRHDLNLIGVVVATLNFHNFFVIVHNFETTVTVLQHTVVVPKPACSYQNYTTFQRCFQVLSWFFVLALFYTFYFFLRAYNFHIVSCTPRSVRDPGLPPGAFALPRCAPQGGCDEGLDDRLMDGIEWWVIADFLKNKFWIDWRCLDVQIALIVSDLRYLVAQLLLFPALLLL